MNIYAGNLDFKVDEEELKSMFEEFGEVASARIISDKYSGKSKGFGFVVMNNDDEAARAIKALNGKTMNNRNIVVSEAKPKKDSFFK
jgi:RNA recognition motif-containing protein